AADTLRRTRALPAATPGGPFSAIRSAIATARPVTSPGGTTSFTRPRSYARPALIASPVSVISNAIPRATLVPRNAPPPAGNSPRFTSGSPNVASDDAMITSHPRSSSKPPASADAFAAPTRGTATAPSVNRRNARPVSSSPRPRVLTGGEGPQVHAGAEGTVTGAGEDEGPDLRIRLGVDDRAADAPDELRGQGVAGVG